MTKTLTGYAEEVLARIEIAPNGCWRWTGYTLPSGYGQIGQNKMVHRVVWQHLRGPIPEGMTLDHECHNRALTCNAKSECPHRRCVNPDHLAVKTRGANTMAGRTPSALNAAKSRCPRGHRFTPDNTYYRPDRFGRMCRRCRYEAGIRFQQRHRARVNEQARERRERLSLVCREGHPMVGANVAVVGRKRWCVACGIGAKWLPDTIDPRRGHRSQKRAA